MPRWDQEYGKVIGENEEKQYEASGLEGMGGDEHSLSKTELGTGRELPRWQTDPVNMIEDVMSRWLGPITDEGTHKGVQDRLEYLKAWLPRLRGYILKQAQTAIKLLEERAAEYQRRNLKAYISQIASFVKDAISDDATFKIAQDYHKSLVVMRPQLRGTWAQVVDKYAGWLKERMDEYRGMTPKPIKVGSLETGQPATPIEEIPDVLRPFWIFVHRIGVPTYRHIAESRYCKIETIQVGKEWRLGFEDMDVSERGEPDWDYDEPTLHVVRTDNQLLVTLQRYGGNRYADIYYGGERLWKEAGGFLGRHVGSSKPIAIGATLPSPEPSPTPAASPLIEAVMKFLPWGVVAASLGYSTWRVAKKK